jgi:hypothetical protein
MFILFIRKALSHYQRGGRGKAVGGEGGYRYEKEERGGNENQGRGSKRKTSS